MNTSTSLYQQKFIHPKFWPVWFLYGCMFIIVHLPHKVRIRTGALLGWLAHLFPTRRRHIAEVNIKLCFPSLSEVEQRNLVRRTFRSIGIGLIEAVTSWIRDPVQLRHLVTINGLPHLKEALAQDKGVLLVGMHATTLDLCGAVLASFVEFDVMYRRNKNALLETIMTRGRVNNFPFAIERDDIRGVIRNLRRGHVVWYGPDQDYGRRHSIFAPFFGVPTASITATIRLAKINRSPVIFFSHHRSEDDQRYIISLSETLTDFPSGDDLSDTTLINERIESAINNAPDQYLWIHRRFKTRPEGESRPY